MFPARIERATCGLEIHRFTMREFIEKVPY